MPSSLMSVKPAPYIIEGRLRLPPKGEAFCLPIGFTQAAPRFRVGIVGTPCVQSVIPEAHVPGNDEFNFLSATAVAETLRDLFP